MVDLSIVFCMFTRGYHMIVGCIYPFISYLYSTTPLLTIHPIFTGNIRKPWFLPSNIGFSCSVNFPIIQFYELSYKNHWSNSQWPPVAARVWNSPHAPRTLPESSPGGRAYEGYQAPTSRLLMTIVYIYMWKWNNIYIYICVCIHVYIYTYIYTYITITYNDIIMWISTHYPIAINFHWRILWYFILSLHLVP